MRRESGGDLYEEERQDKIRRVVMRGEEMRWDDRRSDEIG